jgi:hypothetical protein
MISPSTRPNFTGEIYKNTRAKFVLTNCSFDEKQNKRQQLPLKINNLFLIVYHHSAHREHREMVGKMRDLIQFLRKYALIFLSVLTVISMVKISAGIAD